MKKNLLINLFLILVFAVSTNVIAQVLLEENFDYTAGDLLTDHGWASHSGGGINPVLVTSPGLVFPGQPGSGIGNAALLGNNGEDVNKSFPFVFSGAVFTSVMVAVNVGGGGGYFFHYDTSPTSFSFRGRVFRDDDASNAAFGLSFSSGGGEVYTGFNYNFGETYLLILKYEVVLGTDNDLVSLYIFDSSNPPTTIEPATPTLGPFPAGGAAEINPGTVSIRQFNAAEDIIVDGILVSTNWSDVVGSNGTITIAEAREDLNMDFIPDRLGDIVTVVGTVSSPNYNTGNFNYVIDDGTAGISSIFFGYTGPEYNMGDVVQVTGEITQFAGLTQIQPADDADVVSMGTGGTLPDFTVLTLAEYFTNPESYEGELLAFVSLTAEGSGDVWPTSGSNANFNLTDALDVDILPMRIDKETDLDENPEPIWPKDVIGFGSQFTFDTPPNNGYQNLPRMYSEILPPGTVPVELTSFTASVGENNVTLNWITATELNNSGFDVLRSTEEAVWEKIGFVAGFGTTTEIHSYSFVDENLTSGQYAYRLKQVDFDGTFELSDVVNVEVTNPVKYDLSQNYPNPFNPSTAIKFTLAKGGNVTLKIYNTLGEEVALLVNQFMESGNHEVNFDAFNLGSGIYFYRIEAGDFSQVKKMTLLK